MTEIFTDYGINIPANATGQIYTTCPQCSSTRKKSGVKCLSVNTDEGVWKCHHCGWTGSLKKKEFQPMPKKKYIKPKPITGEKLSSRVIDYFANRKISLDTLTAFNIQSTETYFPQSGKDESAIVFPYYRNGEIVNYKYRSGKKNFKQSKNAEKVFYNLDNIDSAFVIITEGEIDAMSFHEAGYPSVVSVPDGAPAASTQNFNSKFDYLENCEDQLKSVDAIVLAVDNDQPGKILEKELSRRLGRERCYTVSYPDGCKDGNEVLIKYGKDGINTLVGSATPYPIEGVITIDQIENEIEDLYNNGHAQTFSTGFKYLDYHYTVRPGEMTVWTGYTGHGKSEFLDQLLINLYQLHGWAFGICSLENFPVKNHVSKLISKITGKAFFEGDRMTAPERDQAIESLKDHFYFIYPEDVTINSILATAKQLIYQKGINGVVIDPYNELEHKRPKNLTETEYISEFLSKVRRFARDNEIHVWIVAHPKKPDQEIKTAPGLYQITGSANWANKADNGISIFRNMVNDQVEIHIKKIRCKEIGKIGQVNFRYEMQSGKYYEVTK